MKFRAHVEPPEPMRGLAMLRDQESAGGRGQGAPD
jgi:hypothetical protein